MGWIQITFPSTMENAEALSDLLSEYGAAAVTLKDAQDQPIYEPELNTTPVWPHTLVIGLYDADTDITTLIQQLTVAWAPKNLPEHQVQTLPDQVWERAWMDGFKPMQFGQRLWIVPSWHQAPDAKATNILLDPGLAFGTGTHPTTRLCLEWLDQNYHGDNDVIDYGCGSGILAIAAALLGANHIDCIDTDPQALEATMDNGQRNHVESTLSVFLPQNFTPKQVPLLVANILAGPLVELAPLLSSLTQNGGDIVLSGILEEQTEMVRNAYTSWFKIDNAVVIDGWVRLHGIKQG